MLNIIGLYSGFFLLSLVKMGFTQKYTIISPVNEVYEGQFRSKERSIRVTTPDTFRISCLDDYLLNEFQVIPKRPTIKVVANYETFFGENKDVRVMVRRF